MDGQKFDILVADDEPIVRMIQEHLLKEMGHQVTLACNGEEAVQKIKDKSYDLILLDINMPKKSGLEVAQYVRNLQKPFCETPVIGITAMPTTIAEKHEYKSAFNKIINKPISPDMLKKLVLENKASLI